MLLVKTYLAKSSIHGLGVFSAEFIPKGSKVWCFVEGFDLFYSPKEFARLPKPARDFIGKYGYRADGEILLTVDNDRYMNHSDRSNTYWKSGYIVAGRNISKGEEITNNYREFDPALCSAFAKK